MRYIVTGGNGFIGGHVAAQLARQGHDVIVYDIDDSSRANNCGISFVKCDIRNYCELRDTIRDADAVFHFSGVLGTQELFETPREAVDINILGALNVLLACKEVGGNKKLFFPTKPNEWNNVYSATSQAVEKLGHSYREFMDLDVRILRLNNVYGPKQKLAPVRKIVPFFILRALNNQPLEIFGDGSQVLELQYVEDVSDIVVRSVLSGRQMNATYDIPSNVQITTKKLAEQIIQLTDSKSEISYLKARTGTNPAVKFAHGRSIAELIPDIKFTSFDTAIRNTIEWYRSLPIEKLEAARRFYGDR